MENSHYRTISSRINWKAWLADDVCSLKLLFDYYKFEDIRQKRVSLVIIVIKEQYLTLNMGSTDDFDFYSIDLKASLEEVIIND